MRDEKGNIIREDWRIAAMGDRSLRDFNQPSFQNYLAMTSNTNNQATTYRQNKPIEVAAVC